MEFKASLLGDVPTDHCLAIDITTVKGSIGSQGRQEASQPGEATVADGRGFIEVPERLFDQGYFRTVIGLRRCGAVDKDCPPSFGEGCSAYIHQNHLGITRVAEVVTRTGSNAGQVEYNHATAVLRIQNDGVSGIINGSERKGATIGIDIGGVVIGGEALEIRQRTGPVHIRRKVAIDARNLIEAAAEAR